MKTRATMATMTQIITPGWTSGNTGTGVGATSVSALTERGASRGIRALLELREESMLLMQYTQNQKLSSCILK